MHFYRGQMGQPVKRHKPAILISKTINWLLKVRSSYRVETGFPVLISWYFSWTSFIMIEHSTFPWPL